MNYVVNYQISLFMGSGSGLDRHLNRNSDSDPDWPIHNTAASRVSDPDPHGSALIWVAGSGSGSRRAKMTHKNRKKHRIFMFWSAGCSLLRAEGFSCRLGVLYGVLGISKWQFFIKKIKIKFPAVNFFQFLVMKPWIRIRDPDPQLEKMLDPDLYPDPH